MRFKTPLTLLYVNLHHLLDDVTRLTKPLTRDLYYNIKKNPLMFVHVIYHVVQVTGNLITQSCSLNGIM